MSTFKNIARNSHIEKNKVSNHPKATVNRAGGVAFEIEDPATKLVTMTGGSFFAEPNYYSADACIASRGASSKFGKLQARLQVVQDKVASFTDCTGLDDVAQEVIATIWDVLNSENPKDALSIANWLRNEVNIRLTPQIILAIASRHPNAQPFVREYASKIIVRPDEVKSVLLAHRFFFGNKTLKNCLNMGLGDAISKFSEKALIKYDSDRFPKWKDVLRWIKRKQGWPLNKDLAAYFTHGIVSEMGTPIAYKRKLMASKEIFDEEAQRLAIESFANWEVVLSQFGRDVKSKQAVWSFLVENNLLGYMAMLRNVRNMLGADVSMDTVKAVASKLSNEDQVAGSRQLPFRFLMAHRMLKQSVCSDLKASKILEAIETAANISAVNVPVLPGLTAVFADNSASMSALVSGKSKMSCAGAANALCGIVAKRAEDAYVAAFATDVGAVCFTKNDTVIDIAEKVADANTKGWSTNGHRCIKWLESRGIFPDRVIILSDMQCWDDSGGESSVADAWQRYRRNSKSKNTWLHSVHLNGYGDNPVNPYDDKVNLISGFSEKIVTMMLKTEGCLGEGGEEIAVPTVEQIREQW